MTSSGPACSSATSGGWPALARDDALAHGVAGPLPSAQVHARLAGRGRRRDHQPARPRGVGRGQVRRHPGPAPQAGPRRCASTRATCTTSAAATRRSSRPRRRSPGTASSTARSWPGATARSCRSSRSRPASGARPHRTRSGPRSRSSSSPSTCSRWGPVAMRRSRPLLRAPLSARRARLDALELPVAADGGRFARSHLVAASDADALEAAFLESRARRNEGLMVKDPESVLRARPARPRLAQDEEGPGHDRLRRRRRRGRPRQAPRRPDRLHLRRPRRRHAAGWSTSARPTAG